MILFEWVEVKNLMNYGNVPTRLSLNTHWITLISGGNGMGKSSILLDSICYCIFGKPYRDIKLGQLINSINKKNMTTKVAFQKNGDSYCVTRGQKPAIFIIEKNGIPIPEESIRGSYQEFLEGIIGMNFMTFKQVVVIGSANYVPFMRLSTPQRREVVETMLPIKIFTEAARISRERIANVKKEISDLDIRISGHKESLKKSKDILESIQSEKKKRSGDIEAKKSELQSEIDALTIEKNRINIEPDSVSSARDKIKKLTDGIRAASTTLVKTSTEAQALIETQEFFHQDECPTCSQPIGQELKDSINTKTNERMEILNKKKSELETIVANMQQKQDELTDSLSQLEEAGRKLANIEWKISSLVEQKLGLDSVIETDTESKVKKNISQTLSELDLSVSEKSRLVTRQSVLATTQELCKDSGVKSMIVQEFIPMMNAKINNFLQMFDLFVDFELDSEFNETIRSRNRDSFSYNSFSEGEKQRIDLAILFAWREIAIQKNAAVTNLLIFDETLDKSLDADAVDVFMNILESIGKSVHVFVVSHKDVASDVFDRVVKVEKKNDFALLTAT